MLVELKNGDTYNGRLDNCDSWMNIKLKDVIFTSRVRKSGKGAGWRWGRGKGVEDAVVVTTGLKVCLSFVRVSGGTRCAPRVECARGACGVEM